jgi:hypothetical protein
MSREGEGVMSKRIFTTEALRSLLMADIAKTQRRKE